MSSVRKWTVAIAGACLALAHALASAQEAAGYPNKSIRIIVPFPAGGATDIMTPRWRTSSAAGST